MKTNITTTIRQLFAHRISMFAAVGVLNTALDFALLNFLRVITNTTTDQPERLLLLNLASASVVACISFLLNRHFVFKKPSLRHHMVLPFVIITLIGIFVLQSLVIRLSLAYLGPVAGGLNDAVQALGIPVVKNFSINFYEANLAKVCATAVSMVWNYNCYKRFIFK